MKICYHTHSIRDLGMNASALMHLIQGFDPQRIGAFIDPLHFVIEGEEFATGANMVQDYLSIVALKDVLLTRGEKDGHSTVQFEVVPCGAGMVDFNNVFSTLSHFNFQGPLTVHCEFEQAQGEEFLRLSKTDASFALAQRVRYLSGAASQ